MNWIDALVILLLIFFALEGFGRSFIGEFLDFLSFLFAFVFSLRFYNLAGVFYQNNFGIPHSISTVLGFITVWFFTETILFIIVHLLFSKVKLLQILNR